MGETKRINIHTVENKSLGRLCKMCNLFFREFRVITAAIGLQLVCYALAIVLLYHHRGCGLEN
jgi:hypothetical protein